MEFIIELITAFIAALLPDPKPDDRPSWDKRKRVPTWLVVVTIVCLIASVAVPIVIINCTR